MKWEQMDWTAKFNAVADVFGSTLSDCGADELLHLWEQIQVRELQSVYIDALAASLGVVSIDAGYSAHQILQMMLASEVDYHWPAALKAAGKWEY